MKVTWCSSFYTITEMLITMMNAPNLKKKKNEWWSLQFVWNLVILHPPGDYWSAPPPERRVGPVASLGWKLGLRKRHKKKAGHTLIAIKFRHKGLISATRFNFPRNSLKLYLKFWFIKKKITNLNNLIPI